MKKTLLLLALILYGCYSEKYETGNIYGVVTESDTAEPMRAAGVSLFSNSMLLLKTVTYDDGHFEFNDIDIDNNYTIEVETDGYKKVSLKVVVEPGRTARVDMQMSKIYTGLTVITYDPDVNGNKAAFEGMYKYTDSYPFERGFVYGKGPKPTISNGVTIKSPGESSIGNYSYRFSAEAVNLDKGIYYVRAYAKVGEGTEFGEDKRFEITGAPVVLTLSPTNIGESYATLNGKIDYKGDPHYTEKGFVYSSSTNNPTIDNSEYLTERVIVDGYSDDYSSTIGGLTTTATYYVRAYVINDDIVAYGASISFSPSQVLEYIIMEGIGIQKSDIGRRVSYSTATALCNSSRVAEHSNWRLPSIEELGAMYANRSTIGGWDNQGRYWSSTAAFSYEHYCMSFYDGCQVRLSDSTTDYNGYFLSCARCVRSL